MRKNTASKSDQTQPSNFWIAELFASQREEVCKTLGVISGAGQSNDANCLTSIARQVSSHVAKESDLCTLVVHLDVFISNETERLLDQPAGIPPTARSPLGDWREVTVPMPVGDEASWSLLQMPKWLASWRKQFGAIVIDLGPCHLVPARTMGRLCGSNVVLLGPNSTASHEWLSSHLSHLTDCGVSVDGSILASRASAA